MHPKSFKTLYRAQQWALFINFDVCRIWVLYAAYESDEIEYNLHGGGGGDGAVACSRTQICAIVAVSQRYNVM